jgi:hypothetical protein
MAHTITVTRVPDETSDDADFEVGGTHGSDCQTLKTCRLKRCEGLKRDYDWGHERLAHGVWHEYRDGDWLIPSETCGLDLAFEDDMTWNEQIIHAGLGTHAVTVEWDGDWWLMVVSP